MRKLLFIVVILAFSYGSVSSQQQTVRVQLIKGSLFLQQNKEWIKVAIGDVLLQGDVIKTDKRSYAELVYGNTIIVKVAENTQLEIKDLQPAKKTLVQHIGKIWVKVQKLVGEKFEVETRFGTAGVRGTSLGAATDPAQGTDITCEEGRIYLRTLAGTESELNAGERSGFDVNGNLLSTQPLPDGEGFENFGMDSDTGKLQEMLQDIRDLIQEIEALLTAGEPIDEKMKILISAVRTLELYAHANALTIEELPAIKQKIASLGVKTGSSDALQQYREFYEKTQKRIDVWKNKFSLEGAGIDFRALSLQLDAFYIWSKDTRKEIEDKIAELEKIQSNESIPLLQKTKQLITMIESLLVIADKTKAVIAFEEQLYTRMTATREKLSAFKREFEIFSAQMVSSAQWVETAHGMIATSTVTQTTRNQARQWQYFMRRYDALRSEYSDYEKLVAEAKRKGVLFVSGRVAKEAEIMKTLVTSFQVKKGCCNVTMNFGQLRQIFIVISTFLNGEGRVLLQ